MWWFVWFETPDLASMDRVETANAARAKQWTKEAKVGEGTYAVVYRGES